MVTVLHHWFALQFNLKDQCFRTGYDIYIYIVITNFPAPYIDSSAAELRSLATLGLKGSSATAELSMSILDHLN